MILSRKWGLKWVVFREDCVKMRGVFLKVITTRVSCFQWSRAQTASLKINGSSTQLIVFESAFAVSALVVLNGAFLSHHKVNCKRLCWIIIGITFLLTILNPNITRKCWSNSIYLTLLVYFVVLGYLGCLRSQRNKM